MKRKWPALGVGIILQLIYLSSIAQAHVDKFLDELDSIRLSLKIPGMAVAVQQNGKIIAERGFGYADVKNKIPVTPATTFRVASITKTFTSTVVMQLVQDGKLNLSTPISQYGLDLGNPSITVRNLFTHTSEGVPGTHYQYNGYRYGLLTPVIDQAARQPFFQLLMDSIVKRAGLRSTAPNISMLLYFGYLRYHMNMKSNFENAFNHLAKPYELDGTGRIVETTYIDEFGAFGGLTTSVGDLLKYSSAIDHNLFVSAATQKMIFTANHTSDGALTPYGLGWFVENWNGIDFYWHYGQTRGESGIFLKVPSRKLTVAVITNCDRLSTPFPLGDGDLFMSPVGEIVFKYLLNRDKSFTSMDYHQPVAAIRPVLLRDFEGNYKNFYNKEIIVQATMALNRGDSSMADSLYSLYSELNFKNTVSNVSGTRIVSLEKVGVSQLVSKDFILSAPTRLKVYGTGENCSGDFSSWCDYGWIEDSTGKVVWQMQGQPAVHAGGAIKNQHVEAEIELPSGSYKLKYKSDSGHAYGNWDSLPPDGYFWGIILTK